MSIGDREKPGHVGRLPLVAMNVRCEFMDGLRGCIGTENLPVDLAGGDWYYMGKEMGDMGLEAVLLLLEVSLPLIWMTQVVGILFSVCMDGRSCAGGMGLRRSWGDLGSITAIPTSGASLWLHLKVGQEQTYIGL